MRATLRRDIGTEIELKTYDDGMPGFDWPIYVFGNEFGPVAVIRADNETSAWEIWLDEFADIEEWEDFPPECKAAWESDGNTCECHEMAPNGARSGSESDSPYRVNSPYEWFEELRKPEKSRDWYVDVEETDDDDEGE